MKRLIFAVVLQGCGSGQFEVSNKENCTANVKRTAQREGCQLLGEPECEDVSQDTTVCSFSMECPEGERKASQTCSDVELKASE